MEIIKHNPFRVLGLPIEATEKEILKQKSKTQAFLSVGKSIEGEFDFLLLDQIIRNQESLNHAISQLEMNTDKVRYALFWVSAKSPDAKVVFEHLKLGDKVKAMSILERMTVNRAITSQTLIASFNLSTLLIYDSLSDFSFDCTKLGEGLSLKIKVIQSEHFDGLLKSVVGENSKFSKEKLVELTLVTICDELLSRINSHQSFDLKNIESVFLKLDHSDQQILKKNLSKEFINSIEHEIERTKQGRESEAKNAISLAGKLVEVTSRDVERLRSIMGVDDYRFSDLSDKLAIELLQCGIDYFNEFRETTTDPSVEVLKLFQIAQSFALGSISKDRINENIEGIKEWISDKPEREKNRKIATELETIHKLLSGINSYDTAEKLILHGKDKIKIIKRKMGKEDHTYIEISSVIVIAVLNFTVDRVNKAQEMLDPSRNYFGLQERVSSIKYLREELNQSMKLLNLLESFNMNEEVKNHFRENYKTLRGILKQVDPNSSNIRMDLIPRRIVQTISLAFVLLIGYSMLENSIKHSDSEPTNTSEPIESPAVDTTVAVVVENSSEKLSDGVFGQLNNGDSPLDNCFGQGIYYGSANITFKNSNSSDAIVCLVSLQTGKTIRNEYIRAGTDFNMSSIPAGSYYLKVFYGNDWNPKIKNPCGTPGYFEQDVHFSKSDSPSDYIHIKNDEGGYTTGEITLYTVAGGNMDQQRISESEFFR